MKITKLPDQPTPPRAEVRPSARRVRAKGKSRSTNYVPIGRHDISSVNPIWDDRQLALIEEFKKNGPNRCAK